MRKLAWIAVAAALVLTGTGCAGLAEPEVIHIVPASTTAIYGKRPAPADVVAVTTEGAACSFDHVEVVARPDTLAEDDGQTLQSVGWPDPGAMGGTITLLLEREDGADIRSYAGVFGELDNQLIGTGGLNPLGVSTPMLVINISVGDDQRVPDTLTLCRKSGRG